MLFRSKNYPYEDVGCAKIDTQRALRNGAGEVIYGEGKTDDEILRIAAAIGARGQNILITRTNERVFKRVREVLPQAEFNARGRVISVKFKEFELTQNYIAIVFAGTADGAVVEETSISLALLFLMRVISGFREIAKFLSFNKQRIILYNIRKEFTKQNNDKNNRSEQIIRGQDAF